MVNITDIPHQPLAGVVVIDFATHTAGPIISRVLGDWGATVIKVESKEGELSRWSDAGQGMPLEDGNGPSFAVVNVNKRALSIDMKAEGAKEVFYSLLAKANVMCTNMREPALKKLGADWETVHEKFPHLIWARLSGYGEEGAMASEPGFDSVSYFARGGAMLDFCDAKDEYPLPAPLGFGDNILGITLAGGVSAALVKQARTGQGSKVITNLYANAIWAAGQMLQVSQGDKVSYPRSRFSGTPLNNTYRAKDGGWFLFTAFVPKQYAAVAKALGIEWVLNDSRFETVEKATEHNTELIPIIDEAFAKFTTEEAEKMLTENDVPHGQLRHVKDIVTDQQAKDNHMIFPYTFEPTGREYWLASSPIKFDGTHPQPQNYPAPYLAEHTVEVLKEFGFADDKIEDLLNRKVIFQRGR